MVLVAFRLSEALRERMKKSPTYQREGEGQFIREAIAEKLRSMGVEVPNEEVYRGPRTGIGGRPTHRSNRQRMTDVSGAPKDLKPLGEDALTEGVSLPSRAESMSGESVKQALIKKGKDKA